MRRIILWPLAQVAHQYSPVLSMQPWDKMFNPFLYPFLACGNFVPGAGSYLDRVGGGLGNSNFLVWHLTPSYDYHSLLQAVDPTVARRIHL
jgi:hypothetical protein